MAKQEATVSQLVSMIEKGQIQLPEMQRKFVWKSSANTRTEFMKFFLVLLSQFVLNSLLLFICVEYFGLDPLRTQYVIGSILIVSTYFAHRHWTFHPNSRNDEDA